VRQSSVRRWQQEESRHGGRSHFAEVFSFRFSVQHPGFRAEAEVFATKASTPQGGTIRRQRRHEGEAATVKMVIVVKAQQAAVAE